MNVATHLYNFLTSCTEEMKLVVQALGKNSTKDLSHNDLVAIDQDLADTLELRFAGDPRSQQPDTFNWTTSSTENSTYQMQ